MLRDRRDNSSVTIVIIKSNRWYLRILFWTVERAVHYEYIVVNYCVKAGLGDDCWKQYLNKDGGRRRFQLDLCVLLMEFRIRYD